MVTRKSILLLFVLLSFLNIQRAYSQDLWSKTNLSFSYLDSYLNAKDCLASEKQFLGCIRAFESLISKPSKKIILMPNNFILRRNYEKESAILDFYLVHIPIIRADNAQAYSELAKEERTLKKATTNLIKKTYKESPAILLKHLRDLALLQSSEHTQDQIANAMNSYLAWAFDPHTYIVSRVSIDQRSMKADKELIGVGIILYKKDGQVRVKNVIRSSPAELAGIKKNDAIIAIDNDSLPMDPEFDTVIKKIQGVENSSVRLKLLRNHNEVLEKEVIRKKVSIPNVEYSTLESNPKIGYIRLSSFMDTSACAKVMSAIQNLNKQNIESLIFDLRSNGGGRLDVASCITGLFIGQNQLFMTTRPLESKKSESIMTTSHLATDLPMVVLVNSQSASASEIFAGVIQDYERGIVLGETTYGKGTMQGLIYDTKTIQQQFPGLEGVVFAKTTARWVLPSGREIQILGVKPDIEVQWKPNLSEAEKMTYREVDSYENPLPVNEIKVYKSMPHLTRISKTDFCIRDKNLEKTYSDWELKGEEVDFQLMNAQTALECN